MNECWMNKYTNIFSTHNVPDTEIGTADTEMQELSVIHASLPHTAKHTHPFEQTRTLKIKGLVAFPGSYP